MTKDELLLYSLDIYPRFLLLEHVSRLDPFFSRVLLLLYSLALNWRSSISLDRNADSNVFQA